MDKSLFTGLDRSWLILGREIPSALQKSELAKSSDVMLD